MAWTAVGLALVVIWWSLLQPWPIALAMGALLAGACAIVILRLPLQLVGVILIGLFCFTASWDQTAIAGVGIRQIFLGLGGVLLATGLDLRRLPPVPWWLHAYGLSAILVTILQAVFPIDQSYLEGRYATSSLGRDLGEREGALPSLLSLLFNTYAAPLVIVVACMFLPRALRWLIGAYVVGAALSCLAAILGFYGQPSLADLFGGVPTPDGVRASGFTSHPLRLATSGVMAIALAAWMGMQSQRALRWAGWLSTPLLLLGLYVSGSRGGMVSGMLVLILATFLLPDVRSRLHVVISAVGSGLLGLYFIFPSAIYGVLGSTRLSGDFTTTVSDIGRTQLLDQGINDFHASPLFGIGVRFIAEAHTLYVGVLAAGGLLFGLGYFLFNVGSVRASIQSLKVDRSLGGALLATLIASLWYWTVADLIQTKTVACIYGYLIALWWQGQEGSGRSLPGQPYSEELAQRPFDAR